MLHGVLGCDSVAGVALEHLLEEVEACIVKGWHELLKWLHLI